jgi:hypothetical protein
VVPTTQQQSTSVNWQLRSGKCSANRKHLTGCLSIKKWVIFTREYCSVLIKFLNRYHKYGIISLWRLGRDSEANNSDELGVWSTTVLVINEAEAAAWFLVYLTMLFLHIPRVCSIEWRDDTWRPNWKERDNKGLWTNLIHTRVYHYLHVYGLLVSVGTCMSRTEENRDCVRVN